MNRQFLTLTAAVEPLVADGDVIKAVVVVAHTAQAVQRVTFDVVSPVVLGVDAAVGQSVGCILDGVLLLSATAISALVGMRPFIRQST